MSTFLLSFVLDLVGFWHIPFQVSTHFYHQTICICVLWVICVFGLGVFESSSAASFSSSHLQRSSSHQRGKHVATDGVKNFYFWRPKLLESYIFSNHISCTL